MFCSLFARFLGVIFMVLFIIFDVETFTIKRYNDSNIFRRNMKNIKIFFFNKSDQPH